MKEFASMGVLGIVWIAVYFAFLYAVVFLILVPAIKILLGVI
jgi:hypothetical protein